MIFSIRTRGIIEALLSATFFGLIPVLFLPVYEAGISPAGSLVYRFGLAALIMLIPIKLKKHSLHIPLKTLASVTLGGFSYYIGALTLYSSFTYIASGISVTIFFTNPIFVMIVMALFFKETIEGYKIILSLTTMLGIALFSGVFTSESMLDPIGMSLALFSSVSFAFYVLALFTLRCTKTSKEVMSFYLFTGCACFAFVYSVLTGELVLAQSGRVWLFLVLSALFTAVLPNILLMTAIQKIGSVLATILGVMDPITAVILGIVVLGEAVDVYIISGICLVLVSVLLITVLPLMHRKGLS